MIKTSLPLDNINGKIDTFKNASLPPKSIMFKDDGSNVIDNAIKNILGYNVLAINEKTLTAKDNASQPITDAQGNLNTYINTNPAEKVLSASGNASPLFKMRQIEQMFSQQQIQQLRVLWHKVTQHHSQTQQQPVQKDLMQTPTPTKQLEANDNITHKANSARRSD